MREKIKVGGRYYHGLFGWCKVTHPPTDNSDNAKTLIDCEAKVIEYYVRGKGMVKYEKDKGQKGQIVCVPINELFKTEEEVPDIFGLQKLAMQLKITL